MNSIAVAVLCASGESEHALRVLRRVNDDGHVSEIMPLFPAAPQKCRGKFIFFPEASESRRGLARTEMVRAMVSRRCMSLVVCLDDDVLPDPDYFKILSEFILPIDDPVLYTGKLVDMAGIRSWDICSVRDGDTRLVPYEHRFDPAWTGGMFFAGTQHIFNWAGLRLAAQIGYPDAPSDDYHFCRQFAFAGGKLLFAPELKATIIRQVESPDPVV